MAWLYPNLRTNLRGLWDPQGTNGSGSAPTGNLTEWSGNGVTGVRTNLSDSDYQLKGSRYAIVGNGSNGYCTAGTPSLSSGALTVAFWMGLANWNSGGIFQVGMSHNGSATAGWSLTGQTGGSFFDWNVREVLCLGDGYNSGRNPRVRGTTTAGFANNSMHCFMMTLSGSVAKCYVDGADASTGGTAASVPNVTAQNLYLVGTPGTNDYSSGWFSDLAWWDVVLGAQEIADYASARGAMFDVTATGKPATYYYHQYSGAGGF